jgi:hypothetical protein
MTLAEKTNITSGVGMFMGRPLGLTSSCIVRCLADI